MIEPNIKISTVNTPIFNIKIINKNTDIDSPSMCGKFVDGYFCDYICYKGQIFHKRNTLFKTNNINGKISSPHILIRKFYG